MITITTTIIILIACINVHPKLFIEAKFVIIKNCEQSTCHHGRTGRENYRCLTPWNVVLLLKRMGEACLRRPEESPTLTTERKASPEGYIQYDTTPLKTHQKDLWISYKHTFPWLHRLRQGLSASALLIFGAGSASAVGTVLCFVECAGRLGGSVREASDS